VKPEKVRWIGHEDMLVNTNTTVWVKIAITQIKEMILAQLDKVETIFGQLNIPIITPEDRKSVV